MHWLGSRTPNGGIYKVYYCLGNIKPKLGIHLSPDLGIYEVHLSFFRTKLLQFCTVSLKSNIGLITLQSSSQNQKALLSENSEVFPSYHSFLIKEFQQKTKHNYFNFYKTVTLVLINGFLGFLYNF